MKKQGLVITAAIMLTIVAIAAVSTLVWIISRGSPYDGVDTKTFCREGRTLPITIVLVDATDQLEPAQMTRLVGELNSLKESQPRFGHLVLYVVDGNNPSGVGEPLASVCNPGKPEDADKFMENARIIGNKYSKLFDVPFEEALATLAKQNPADKSPIIEAIETATVSTFGAYADGQGEKRVIVISDMLQNRDQVSFYKKVPTFSDFEASDTFRMHRPFLKGVDVKVWEVNRPGKRNNPTRVEVAAFWKNYFESVGAKIDKVWWDATRI